MLWIYVLKRKNTIEIKYDIQLYTQQHDKVTKTQGRGGGKKSTVDFPVFQIRDVSRVKNLKKLAC